MSISATAGGWFLGKLGDLALEEGRKGLWKKISERGAQKALANACETALEAAATEAPSLREDLRSESFRNGVVLPLVKGLLEDPSGLVEAETFASRYVDMFVERFSDREGVDAALQRIFQTDREALVRTFEDFLKTLKGALYGSSHWREAQHYHTTEVTAVRVDRILTLLDERQADVRAASVDLNQARRDAAAASAEMRAWPSDIHGIRLETPAFTRLLRRILDNPSHRTLLVGEAGTGKSALLAKLAEGLEAEGVTVFAIKADLLPASIATLEDLAAALGMQDGLEDRIAALAAERPVALLLDQLDAVSDVMDRQSNRMQLLLQLVHRLGARERAGDAPLRVHVLVSSRPFEAAHDARFQQLKADTIRLDLLEEAQVTEMLTHLGLGADAVDAGLRQTLRRPFALKLFADIVVRGAESRDLTSAGLLEAWLATADLGSPEERRATSAFLTALAEEMIATETLWRPIDTFELTQPGPLRRAEAAGLIVTSAGKVGFSHQSWLDDFQAKTFRTGNDLADYAWARQDSLFVRASILRALERLRIRDHQGYEGALRALLGTARTRRHVLHLIADILATVSNPLPVEIGWIVHWIRDDPPLATRALRQIVPRWENWRSGLRDELPTLMTIENFHWHAAALLAAEVRFDADYVARLIDQFWNDPARDRLVFEILEGSGFVGLEVEARLRTIFSRTPIGDHAISHLVSTLRAQQRFEEAAAIVTLWLEFQDVSRPAQVRIYDLEKLAQAAPLSFARKLLPWFIKIASKEVDPEHDIVAKFPRSRSLPSEWHLDRGRGSPFESLHEAIELLGSQDHKALWELLEPLIPVAIDQVQELIAVGLAAAGPALARQSFQFLLEDARRLEISHVVADVDEGLIGSIYGWHSQELVRTIMPALDEAEIIALRDAIEGWSYYTDAAIAEDQEHAARRQESLDEHRFPLLEALPSKFFDEARQAQIEKWRARRRRVEGRPRVAQAACWVGSPMTHEEMAAASDSEILALMDEFHDASGEHRWTRPISRSGGVRELARAFGAFGKADHQRGMTIGRCLDPNRHQRTAGALVRELSEAEKADPIAVLGLILEMDGRGFSSSEWRQDAANAFQKIAHRLGGLDDGVVLLLEGWLEIDPERIAAQITDRLDFEARNPRDRGSLDNPHPVLFGSGGGIDILPNDNFTILSAISAVLLHREEPDYEAWTAVLERHAERPEDPAIWSAILTWRGKFLFWADPKRVSALFERLFQRFPEAWQDVHLIQFLWRLRPRLPDSVLIAAMIQWMLGQDIQRQAAGEFLTAAHLVEPEEWRYKLLFDRLQRSDPATETGVLFSASAAWHERDPVLRPAAHTLLMAALQSAEGPAAHALSRAVDTRPELIPDKLTRELLAALPNHIDVLRASLTNFFADALQALLFYPGFDEVVMAVVERIAELITESQQRSFGLGQDLVHVAIALQRSDGPLRSRAMDVYERLLDSAVYGAEQAAQASLER